MLSGMSRNVACPACKAPLGSPCKGQVASGYYHLARIKAHRAAYVRPKPKRRGKRTKTTSAWALSQPEYKVLCEGLEYAGVRSLAAYWKSPHWQHMIGVFERQQEIPKLCQVCGSTNYVLHHRTYKRLGREWMTDLVPLCRTHHGAAHELMLARTPGVTLWNVHKHVSPARSVT